MTVGYVFSVSVKAASEHDLGLCQHRETPIAPGTIFAHDENKAAFKL